MSNILKEEKIRNQTIKITLKDDLRDIILLGKFDDSIQVNNNEHICKDGTIYDYSSITDMSFMFLHHEYLEKIPLFDTSNVTKMNNMFDECHNLKTIPLFDTSNVSDMSYMFYGCSSLTTIPLFDTSNVIDMDSMLMSCSSLINIPLLDISNINYIQNVLHGCTLIPTIEKLKFYVRIKKDAFFIKTIQRNHNSFSKRQLLNILAEYE